MNRIPSHQTIVTVAVMHRAFFVLVVAISSCLLVSCGGVPSGDRDGGTWVTAIRSSNRWAVFPCKDYFVTNVCSTDKDYSDPGSVPPVITVGDTISYRAKNGESKRFSVRQINYFIYDKDVDFTWGGKRYTAKKGETNCTLYDVRSRSATADSAYPSRLIVVGCSIAQ